MKGALNRAKAALKSGGSDYGVGIEGAVEKIGDKWFESGTLLYLLSTLTSSLLKAGLLSLIKMEKPESGLLLGIK